MEKLPHAHFLIRDLRISQRNAVTRDSGIEEPPPSLTWNHLTGNHSTEIFSQNFTIEAQIAQNQRNKLLSVNQSSITNWRCTYIVNPTDDGGWDTTRSWHASERVFQFRIARWHFRFRSISQGTLSRMQSTFKRLSRWGLERIPRREPWSFK